MHEKVHLTSNSGRVYRFLNYYDKFDSNWLEVAVKLVFMHGLDSVVNRVYSLEISQTRQRQHRDGIVSVMNTEGKWITARKRSVLLDY